MMNRFFYIGFAVAVFTVITSLSSFATTLGDGLSNDDAIGRYLMTHPEVLKRALINMQDHERQQQQAAMKTAVKENRTAVLDVGPAVVDGAVEGDVTLVEFLDYNCGYCKNVAGNVTALLKADSRVRVLYRMFPILRNEGSKFAAAFVIAVKEDNPTQALALHHALMGYKGQVDQETVLRLAGEVGINIDGAKARMVAAGQVIDAAIGLGHRLGISGTPSFIVGDEVFVGAQGPEELAARVAAARGAGKPR